MPPGQALMKQVLALWVWNIMDRTSHRSCGGITPAQDACCWLLERRCRVWWHRADGEHCRACQQGASRARQHPNGGHGCRAWGRGRENSGMWFKAAASSCGCVQALKFEALQLNWCMTLNCSSAEQCHARTGMDFIKLRQLLACESQHLDITLCVELSGKPNWSTDNRLLHLLYLFVIVLIAIVITTATFFLFQYILKCVGLEQSNSSMFLFCLRFVMTHFIVSDHIHQISRKKWLPPSSEEYANRSLITSLNIDQEKEWDELASSFPKHVLSFKRGGYDRKLGSAKQLASFTFYVALAWCSSSKIQTFFEWVNKRRNTVSMQEKGFQEQAKICPILLNLSQPCHIILETARNVNFFAI